MTYHHYAMSRWVFFEGVVLILIRSKFYQFLKLFIKLYPFVSKLSNIWTVTMLILYITSIVNLLSEDCFFAVRETGTQLRTTVKYLGDSVYCLLETPLTRSTPS